MVQQLLQDDFANWTYEGASGLIDFLLEIFGDETNWEFDRIALRCEYHEYESKEDFHNDYGDCGDIDNRIVASCSNGHVIVYQG